MHTLHIFKTKTKPTYMMCEASVRSGSNFCTHRFLRYLLFSVYSAYDAAVKECHGLLNTPIKTVHTKTWRAAVTPRLVLAHNMVHTLYWREFHFQ